MSNIDIDEILNTINSNKLKNLEDIETERKQELYNYYKQYLGINKNIQNLKLGLEKLKDYEFISFEEIENGDYIKYVNDRYFYDVELKPGGFVVGRQDDKLILKSDVSLFKVRSKIYFRKINGERKAKLMLMDMINRESLNF
jgi:hypothetical protein